MLSVQHPALCDILVCKGAPTFLERLYKSKPLQLGSRLLASRFGLSCSACALLLAMLSTDFCGNHSVHKYIMYCWKMCTLLYTLLSDRRLDICLQIEAKRLWKLNEALSLGILSPVASLYTPLAPPSGARGLPHLHWQPDRAFHTGALCAAALDSVTLPYRLHRPAPTCPLGAATGACCTVWHQSNSGPHLKSQLSSCSQMTYSQKGHQRRRP